MPLVRQQDDPKALEQRIREIWLNRSDRYSEIRGDARPGREKVEMYRMGG
jgi:hypothetical protein